MINVALKLLRYQPTVAITGDDQPAIYRGKNLILRGLRSGSAYLRAYLGSLDLNEDYDITLGEFTLTGTLAYTADSNTVTGTGTSFESELHLGQMILSDDQVFVVDRIVSDTEFISDKPADATSSGESGQFMPVLFELDKDRGVAVRGNAIEFEKGHIMGVGDGHLYRNGSKLGGTSLELTRRAQVALFDPATGNFTPTTLGFDNPPTTMPDVSNIAGGSKAMAINRKHSFLISYLNTETEGYSNPSEPIRDDTTTTNELQVLTAQSVYEFDFTATIAAAPSNCDGFVIWGTLSSESAAVNEVAFREGPFFEVARVRLNGSTATPGVEELDANDKFELEYLDSEVGALATGNNDAPSDAEFVNLISGEPVLVSALGKKTASSALGSSPGKSIIPVKQSNRDAFPVAWAARIKNTIIGAKEAVGRLFLMTPNSLEFGTSTGRVEFPITTRPFWRTGFKNPYALTFVDEILYGFSSRSCVRSAGNGDETSVKRDFAADIAEVTQTWFDGYSFVVEDPVNQSVCFVQAATRRNNNGYWESDIIPFNLLTNTCMPPIVIADPDEDRIICGAATINGRFEFLAGGRTQSKNNISTYRFDEVSGESVDWYLASQPTDSGTHRRLKQIKAVSVTGRITSPVAQIHGAGRGGSLIPSNVENGTSSLSGDFLLGTTTEITRSLERRVLFKNLSLWSFRIAGTWDGTGEPDRIDEINVEVALHGGTE